MTIAPRAVKARLVAMATADGITEMGEQASLGDEYLVFPATVRDMVWGRAEDPSIRVVRPSIFVAPSRHGHEGWLPLELLKLEADA